MHFAELPSSKVPDLMSETVPTSDSANPSGDHLSDHELQGSQTESLPILLKTQGELESIISQEMKKFQLEHLGRGPSDVRVYLIGNLILVRLQGVLTAAERHLVAEVSRERGRALVKEVRTHLVEGSRKMLDKMIFNATGVSVLSMHHDISTKTGEEIIIFSLKNTPCFRDPKRR